MRKRCLDVVYRLAKANKDVVFVGSDLGVGVLDNFKKEMPERFFMDGVSEQHLVGACAGLAMSGKIVYFNTIATFLTRRAFEQNVIDLGLTKAKVRILGSGGGLVYAPLGPTHLAFEDVAIMRAIPNFTIVAPADAEEMERMMLKSEPLDGPLYVRIAKGGDPVVTKPELGFEFGKAYVYSEPGDLLLITTGIMLNRALEVQTLLKAEGISVGIVHCPTIKPLDTKTILREAVKAKAVLTLEEHTILGGLGSAVAEALAESGLEKLPLFKRVGVPDVFPERYGSQNTQLEDFNLNAHQIVDTAKKVLSRRLAKA
jgi:transketolase